MQQKTNLGKMEIVEAWHLTSTESMTLCLDHPGLHGWLLSFWGLLTKAASAPWLGKDCVIKPAGAISAGKQVVLTVLTTDQRWLTSGKVRSFETLAWKVL